MPSKKLIAQLNLQRTKIFVFVCCLIVFLTASRTISWGEDEEYAEDVNVDGRGRGRPEQVSNNVRQRWVDLFLFIHRMARKWMNGGIYDPPDP